MDNMDKKALGSALIGGGVVLIGGKVVDYIRGKILEHKLKKAMNKAFGSIFNDHEDMKDIN